MFVKIDENVSDQDIQEWVKGENEDGTFLTEEEIIEFISDTEHEDVGNQESDEEMPSVNLVRHEEATKCFSTCFRWACENNLPSQQIILLRTLQAESIKKEMDTKKQTRITDFFCNR
ncbi:hypothetical protein QE152_g23464 [Popillia japonica]|uniref:Uncharacterized protein n=1 Tax=Popillia japonica TaxID=7064 RepID=A0AAW1KFA8_POPJA